MNNVCQQVQVFNNKNLINRILSRLFCSCLTVSCFRWKLSFKDHQLEHLIQEERQSEALEARFPQEISDVDLESYPVGVSFFKKLEKLFRLEAEFESLNMTETEDVELLNYLYATHDFYLSKKLPEIEHFMFNLREETDDPLLLLLENYFEKFRSDLIEHIMFEERKIFPLLLNCDVSELAVYHILEDLDRHDHENEDELEMIMSVLEDRLKHQPEAFGFGVLMNMLRQFLWDLQIHAKLEDKLLIPRLKATLLYN